MIIISYSEVIKWQTCHRQYYYRFSLNRAPIEESDAIQTGVKGHKLLQNFYELLKEGKDKDEALKIVREKANNLANKGRGILGPDFPLLKAWTLVDNYIRETDFTSDTFLVENRFLVPATQVYGKELALVEPWLDDVQFGFTPDIVFQRNGGKLDVEDSKFVQREWSKSKKNRFTQIKLYKIFMDRMGYDVSRCILRFFNVTTGNISHQDYFPTRVEEQTLLRDFMSPVKEIYFFKTQNADMQDITADRTQNYTACQFCPFEFPCTLQAEGKDASRTLETQYKESNYDYAR